MTNTAISPLRRRMIEDMTIRQLGAELKLATSGRSSRYLREHLRKRLEPSRTWRIPYPARRHRPGSENSCVGRGDRAGAPHSNINRAGDDHLIAVCVTP